MCLGEVGRVVQICTALSLSVDIAGRKVEVSPLLLDGPVQVGEWLLVHSGVALDRLAEDEARELIGLHRAVVKG